jgi:hypothetical protein
MLILFRVTALSVRQNYGGNDYTSFRNVCIVINLQWIHRISLNTLVDLAIWQDRLLYPTVLTASEISSKYD